MVSNLNSIEWNSPVLSIGEVMIEFAPDFSDYAKRGVYSLSFAGDAFNTAVLLSIALLLVVLHMKRAAYSFKCVADP